MFADKILRNCLMFSIVVHAIFIFNARPFKIFPNIPLAKKELEVTYYKKIGNILPKAIVAAKEKIAGSVSPQKQKVSLEKRIEKRIKSAEKIHRPFIPSTEKIRLSKAILKQDKWQIFHKSKDLSSESSYLRYHNIVRAKIERTANANKPYIFRVGEVNLLFTILNSGDLKSADLVNKGSIADPVLRQSALDSVYAASPFPPFTKEMHEDYLTLQVAISFEK